MNDIFDTKNSNVNQGINPPSSSPTVTTYTNFVTLKQISLLLFGIVGCIRLYWKTELFIFFRNAVIMFAASLNKSLILSFV